MEDHILNVSLTLNSVNPDVFISWLGQYLNERDNYYQSKRSVYVTYVLDSNIDKWSPSDPSGSSNWLYELCLYIGSCGDPIAPGFIPFGLQPLYHYSPEKPSEGAIEVAVTNEFTRPSLQWLLYELLGAATARWPEIREQLKGQGIDLGKIAADIEEAASKPVQLAVSARCFQVMDYIMGSVVGVLPRERLRLPWGFQDLDAGINRNLHYMVDDDDRLSVTRDPIGSTSVMYELSYLESNYRGVESLGRLEVCEWDERLAATRFSEPPRPPLQLFADEAERENEHRRRVQRQKTLFWELSNRMWLDHNMQDSLLSTHPSVPGKVKPETTKQLEPEIITPTEGAASDILPHELHEGGRYGTNRDLTFEDVQAIVTRYLVYREEKGGKVPDFYDQLNLDPLGPRYFSLETLRKWIRDPRFAPKDT